MKSNRTLSVRWRDLQFWKTGAIPLLLRCEQKRLDGWLLPPKRQEYVRVLDSTALELFKTNQHEFERKYGSLPQAARNRLLGLMVLIDAAKQGNSALLDSACSWLWPDKSELAQNRRFFELNPTSVLGKLLPEGLEGVEFVLWQDARDEEYVVLLPGLYCPNVHSALYALTALYHVEGDAPGTWGACLNCGRLLAPKRKTRKFCSGSCRAKWDRKYRKPEREARRKKSPRKRG